MLFAAPSFAAPPATDAGRFQLAPTDSGVTRIDTATGAISHCTEQNGAWTCQTVASGVERGITTATTATAAPSPTRTLAAVIVGRLLTLVKALKRPHAG